ncbi:MAG: hypothetical protein KAR06_03755 [Deltaproteobacteria bacterium]|nr:hypothetical protein [Deltaproteobacteria bacterium]
MAVNDTTPSVQYTATASQTTFAYPFEIFEDADLKVYQVSSSGTPDDTTDILTLTTHYTVTGAGADTGGNVVLVTGATAGDVITIKRDLAVKRTTDYQNLGDLASASFNTDLDKLVMMTQQNEEAFGRSISLQESTQTPTTFDIDDPIADHYAAAKSDLSGIKWVTLQSSGDLTVSAYIATLLDDANAAAARLTLDAASLTTTETVTGDNTYSGDNTHSGANTHSGVNTFTGKVEFDATTHQAIGANIASATTLPNATDGNYNHVTGTTDITAITTTGEIGTIIYREFDGTLTLTHHATNLILFDALNIITADGDVAKLIEYASGDFKLIDYTRLDGTSLIRPVGAAVQVVNVQDGAVATGTNTIPDDDSIPQNTEGDEYMTLAITPTNSSNKLKIDVVFFGTQSVATYMILSLFQDSTSSAIASSYVYGAQFQPKNTKLTHYMTAGTTSETTFKVRAGPSSAATLTFNGRGSARRLGGSIASSITITEIKV